MDSDIPSLKAQVGEIFQHLEKDYNEKVLHRHIHNLVSMLLSEKFKHTCAHSHWYRCIDSEKVRLHYELKITAKALEISNALGIDVKSEFIKCCLGYQLELMYLFFNTTKKAKIATRRRMDNLKSILSKEKYVLGTIKLASFITLLRSHAIKILTDAIANSLF